MKRACLRPRDQDDSAERLAWIADALSDEAGLALAECRSVDEAKGIRAIPIAVEGGLTALACSGPRNL
jgi:hypothetical protein